MAQPSDDKASIDFSYTQNRELSWLQFDNRVLDEGRDPQVPLLERLKMEAIFESNLDEFFMIRVGSLSELAALKKQPVDNKSNQTPAEQVASIYKSLPPLIEKHGRAVAKIESELAAAGLQRVGWADFTDADAQTVENYFDDMVLPIVSPQVIDPRHPFPNLRNGALYAVYNLSSADEAGLLGLIEVPPTLPRTLKLASGARSLRYTLMEDVILACGPELFGDYHTSQRAVIRVTRNADIDPDDGSFDVEDDYRDHIKKILKRRLRLNPVRLEVQGTIAKPLVKQMKKALGLSESQVFSVSHPLSMGAYAFGLESAVPRVMAEDLCYAPFSPQPSAHIEPDVPMWRQIRERDILLFYPYESMEPFLRLIHESAHDPEVMQIKITLYRVAKKSRLCESLIAASENGIDVTVLMELRARFDEENNIEWAERLEDAGCTVLYGAEGFKVHSKICQITRRSGGELMRITQLGTGNYNEKTAGLYADYSLMTADPRIGEDANRFFRNLQIGNLQGEYHTLGVAPVGLKPLIMRGLNREIAKARAGEPAYVVFKMNSLTDREVIDKISEASCAGVRVDLIIRGISCLLPGIPGKTENVHVRSIVGRMLEHARVYSFGAEHDTIYLSSADMMTRNTEHRVEIAYPLLDPVIRDQVFEDVSVQLRDNVKARVLRSDGTYEPVAVAEGEPRVNAQDYFMRRAIEAAAATEREQAERAHARHERPVPDGGVPEIPLAAPSAPAAVIAQKSDARVQIETSSAADERVQVAEPAEAAQEEADAHGKVEVPTPEVAEPAADEGIKADAPSEAEGTSKSQAEAEHATCSGEQAEEATPKPEGAENASESDAAAESGATAAGDEKAAQVEEPEKAAETPAEAEVEVEAKTIPAPDEEGKGAAGAPTDMSQALALMVQKQGRASTAWALIKCGFAILFKGRVD